MIRKILVALDGSQPARRAFDLAVVIAKAFDAELILLHILSDQPLAESERQLVETEYQVQLQAALGGSAARGSVGTSPGIDIAIRAGIGREILTRAEDAARRKGLASVRTILKDGDAASNILEVGESEQPDLLVLGSRGLGGMQRLLMGSVSQKVSHVTKCNVVIVK
jgi:nucleotide-binding universal stress UspA family protein